MLNRLFRRRASRPAHPAALTPTSHPTAGHPTTGHPTSGHPAAHPLADHPPSPGPHTGAVRALGGRTPAALPPGPPPLALPQGDGEQLRETHDVWSTVCDQFALRILGLAETMREQLDKVEATEQDPDKLDELYRLDHAATRVQRLAENLHVIAGRRGSELNGQRTSLLDVIRGAMSAIEHYSRIEIRAVISLAIAEWAADDVSRLLAEVLDNATRYSPPTAAVTVSAHLTDQGNVLLRIEDVGIGLDASRLAALNAQLAADVPALDRRTVTSMGLAVVHRLARLHGIGVQLVGRESFGTTVLVLLPARLLCEVPAAGPRQPALAHSTAAAGVPATHTVAAHGVPPRGPAPAPYPRRPQEQPSTAGTPMPLRNGHSTGVPTAGTAPQHAAPAPGPGLPRRQSASIRRTTEAPLPPVPPPPLPAEDTAERPAWQDDLVAFTMGDEAGRQPGTPPEAYPPAEQLSHQPEPYPPADPPQPPYQPEAYPAVEAPLPPRQPEAYPAAEPLPYQPEAYPAVEPPLPPRQPEPYPAAEPRQPEPYRSELPRQPEIYPPAEQPRQAEAYLPVEQPPHQPEPYPVAESQPPGRQPELFRPAEPPPARELFQSAEPPQSSELFQATERFRTISPFPAREPHPGDDRQAADEFRGGEFRADEYQAEGFPPDEFQTTEHPTTEHPTTGHQLPPRPGLPGESAAEGRNQP